MTTVTVPVIRTEEDLDRVLERIYELWGSPPGTPDGDELETLIVLAQAFEQEHFPMPPPTPIEVVQFIMDQHGLTQQDLVPVFGSSAKVSEFLSGKRQLSKAQIVALHKTYNVPYESLLG
jgi:HTH-type transcriptional regulator/antitoxin HigA